MEEGDLDDGRPSLLPVAVAKGPEAILMQDDGQKLDVPEVQKLEDDDLDDGRPSLIPLALDIQRPSAVVRNYVQALIESARKEVELEEENKEDGKKPPVKSKLSNLYSKPTQRLMTALNEDEEDDTMDDKEFQELFAIASGKKPAVGKQRSRASQRPPRESSFLDSNTDSVLFMAAMAGDCELLEAVVKAGTDVDTRHKTTFCTPLMIAAEEGHVELIRLLVTELGADIQLHDFGTRAQSALTRAVIQGQLEAARELLVLGADPNERDSKNWTALMWASCLGNPKMVTMLIELGATDLDIQDDTFQLTALMLAAREGDLDTCKELLEPRGPAVARQLLQSGWGLDKKIVVLIARLACVMRKADWTLKDRNERTAIAVALDEGHSKCARYLAFYAKRAGGLPVRPKTPIRR